MNHFDTLSFSVDWFSYLTRRMSLTHWPVRSSCNNPVRFSLQLHSSFNYLGCSRQEKIHTDAKQPCITSSSNAWALTKAHWLPLFKWLAAACKADKSLLSGFINASRCHSSDFSQKSWKYLTDNVVQPLWDWIYFGTESTTNNYSSEFICHIYFNLNPESLKCLNHSIKSTFSHRVKWNL